MLRLLFAALFGMLVALPARAQPAETAGLALGDVHVGRPSGPALALVYLISDEAGWSVELEKVASELAARQVATIGLDLPSLLAAQHGRTGECLYLAGDLEAMSHRLQRELGTDRYLTPILAGLGGGATLAYAVLAQAPPTMLDGAVALDPAETLSTDRPLCAGAPVVGEHGRFSYGRLDRLPGWWLVGTRAGRPDPVPWIEGLANAKRRWLPGDMPADRAILELLRPSLDEIARSDEAPLADLPLTELPATEPGPLLAIVLSGDGGWRDIDKQIAGWLAGHGVAAIGIDSMRYFWSARTPEILAQDLHRIARHYLTAWNRQAVVLVGYSFGADVLPAAMASASAGLRSKVVQVSLLALSDRADFEFHVSGWLGAQSDDAQPTLPDLLRLDPGLIQCFYGRDEASDSPCARKLPGMPEIVETRGGHHFDGDYGALARQIRDGAVRRLKARS